MNVSYLDSINQWISEGGQYEKLEDFMLENRYEFLDEIDEYYVMSVFDS